MPIYTIKLTNRYESASVHVFEFEKPTGFQFTPGQYAGFTLLHPKESDPKGHTRRFSLLSTPDDPFIAIATRIQQSAYKSELNKMTIGDEIKLAGPTGNFVLQKDDSSPVVFIAGGIGITPFYSMLCDEKNHPSGRPIVLFYGNQSREQVAFLSELEQIEKSHSNIKIIHTLEKADNEWSGERGFITNQMIKKYIKDVNRPFYYICGSPAMVTNLQETLAEMGINEDRLLVEDFPGY